MLYICYIFTLIYKIWIYIYISNKFAYIHIIYEYICTFLTISLSIYIYIYIYRLRTKDWVIAPIIWLQFVIWYTSQFHIKLLCLWFSVTVFFNMHWKLLTIITSWLPIQRCIKSGLSHIWVKTKAHTLYICCGLSCKANFAATQHF